jgi:hypothetical protein
MPIDAKDKDVQWMRAALENKVVPAIGSDDVSLLRVFSLSLSHSFVVCDAAVVCE